MKPREMMKPIGSEPVTEWRMALIVAMHCWRGTSLVEGALDVLRQMHEEASK